MAFQKVDKTQILKDILKTKNAPGGVWLLCGEEAYLSGYYRNLIRGKIIPDPDMGYFDHIRLSGAERGTESLAEQVQNACAGLPVMCEGKLIEIAEPDFFNMPAAEFKDLCTVFGTVGEYPYVTVLIHCAEEEFPTADYKAPQSAIWKGLEACGVQIVPFAKQDEKKLAPWCAKHFASEGIEAGPGVIEAMIARTGTSMSALVSEMAKLCAYTKANGRSVVTREDVETVCSVTETAQEFGIQNAVRMRDTGRLMREYLVAKHRHEEPMNLFFQISAAVMELWRIKGAMTDGMSKEDIMRRFRMKEYPLKMVTQGAANYSMAALDRLATMCAETDAMMKSSPVDGYVLVERLICAVGKSFGA